jgi:hypothetical protein
MKKLIRSIRRKFTKDLEGPLEWNLEDFERGKRWAKSQDATDGSNRSLWDQIYSPRKDSSEIIAEINDLAEL